MPHLQQSDTSAADDACAFARSTDRAEMVQRRDDDAVGVRREVAQQPDEGRGVEVALGILHKQGRQGEFVRLAVLVQDGDQGQPPRRGGGGEPEESIHVWTADRMALREDVHRW